MSAVTVESPLPAAVGLNAYQYSREQRLAAIDRDFERCQDLAARDALTVIDADAHQARGNHAARLLGDLAPSLTVATVEPILAEAAVAFSGLSDMEEAGQAFRLACTLAPVTRLLEAEQERARLPFAFGLAG